MSRKTLDEVAPAQACSRPLRLVDAVSMIKNAVSKSPATVLP